MILTVLGGFVILAAIFAARGYRGRVSTIGVDLGTTFSVVGVNIGNKVQIVSDSRNHTIFPSVVSYLLDGSVIAGYDALERLSTFPLDTIYESKRVMGRSLGEEGVQNYASGHQLKCCGEPNACQASPKMPATCGQACGASERCCD